MPITAGAEVVGAGRDAGGRSGGGGKEIADRGDKAGGGKGLADVEGLDNAEDAEGDTAAGEDGKGAGDDRMAKIGGSGSDE